MTKILTIILILISISVFGQKVNYELKAIEYFINQIESDTIFHQGCDCVYYDYDKNKTLTIYDSSFSEIEPKMALTAFQFEWADSLLWTSLNSEKIQLKSDSNLGRINLTTNPKNFDENHYLIRFSDRLHYGNHTFIEFNIKSEKRCSGINYLFLFNDKGLIENYKMTIWCDSQG